MKWYQVLIIVLFSVNIVLNIVSEEASKLNAIMGWSMAIMWYCIANFGN